MHSASIYQIKGELSRGNNTISSLRSALIRRYYDNQQVSRLIRGLILNGFLILADDGALTLSSKEYRLQKLKERGVI